MLSLIPACLLASSVDCFGVFADFSLPIGFFRLTALTFSLILACLLASLGDRFEAFADSGLPIGFFRLTALALSLISACFFASLVDCFGDFFYSSLPIGLFGWLLWRFRWFRLAFLLLWLTALGTFSISACLSASLGDCFGAFADSSLFLPLYINCY